MHSIFVCIVLNVASHFVIRTLVMHAWRGLNTLFYPKFHFHNFCEMVSRCLHSMIYICFTSIWMTPGSHQVLLPHMPHPAGGDGGSIILLGGESEQIESIWLLLYVWYIWRQCVSKIRRTGVKEPNLKVLVFLILTLIKPWKMSDTYLKLFLAVNVDHIGHSF